jgi:hypothetical protein
LESNDRRAGAQQFTEIKESIGQVPDAEFDDFSTR